MKIIKYPGRKTWKLILKRAVQNDESLFSQVKEVIEDIKLNGDKAIKKYTQIYDKVTLDDFKVPESEINNSSNFVNKDLKIAINQAKDNIEKFHKSQLSTTSKVNISDGIQCWSKSVPISKVGLYIPGGSAPLFSTFLMLGIPAKIAGCREIVVCTPPSSDGSIDNTILYCAKILEIKNIYKIGGIQAIAAMAYGTKTVPVVDKIFGPGNNYVTVAKQIVSLKDVAIDMPAGPSEVLVIADKFANPVFVASDLLSQAEHSIDSQVILVTVDENIIRNVQIEINKQVRNLPRKNIALKALSKSLIILLPDYQQVIDLTNEYAPEHLIINTENYLTLSDKIINAGSVFLGQYSCESAGDYASGTNHTLPTNGFAKAHSGLNMDSFMKKITFQLINENGLKSIAKTIETMAEAEKLTAHSNAVKLRFNS